MSGAPLLSNAKLFELSPEHVDEGARIGFLHVDKAAVIGRLMAVDGQRDPIKVVANPKNPDKPWRLVTGMHRLIGARIESITVWAIEVSGKPEDLADLEASENTHRRPLGPIEQAKFIAALVQAIQERIARQHGTLNHQKLGAKARWARVEAHEITPEQAISDETEDAMDTLSSAYGWKEDAAAALGMDKKKIQRALSLHRLLVEPFPELIEELSKHPVVGENAKQLTEIAQVKDETKRRQVIETLLADNELSADEARVQCGIDKDTSEAARRPLEKYRNQIRGGWSHMNLTEKREFIPTLAQMLHTPDLKRAMRDRLNEELGDE